jgi:DNA-directed RNA polymerase sigma subunit (sigma70/sigma32)
MKGNYTMEKKLTERERDALVLRKCGCTFAEIGNYFGVTQPRAYQIFAKATAKGSRARAKKAA